MLVLEGHYLMSMETQIKTQTNVEIFKYLNLNKIFLTHLANFVKQITVLKSNSSRCFLPFKKINQKIRWKGVPTVFLQPLTQMCQILRGICLFPLTEKASKIL